MAELTASSSSMSQSTEMSVGMSTSPLWKVESLFSHHATSSCLAFGVSDMIEPVRRFEFAFVFYHNFGKGYVK